MNILYLPQRVPYPPNKGEKLRTFHQIKHLRQCNHNILLCSPISDNSEEKNINRLNESFDCLMVKQVLPPKLFRILTGLVLGKPFSVTNFYSNKLQHKLDELLKKHPIDALVCTSSSMAEYVFRSKIIPKINKNTLLLMDFMDLDSDKWNQYANTSTWPMKWIYRREAILLSKYEQRIQRYFDASFFISEAEASLYEKQTGSRKKIHVMGNGVDMDEFYPPNGRSTVLNKPIFLFTGVMDYKPNVDAVIWLVGQVWPQVLAHYPDARFIIAGMNPTPHVRKLTELPGVEVTGYIDEILTYYHKADIFVSPLQIARGIQNKILQAMACELPVVASSMGAEGILYENEKNILIADTPDEFISQVERIMHDTELRQNIGQNGRRLIEDHYSWESHLMVMDDILSIAHL